MACIISSPDAVCSLLIQKRLAPSSIQGRMVTLVFYAKVQGCKGSSIDFHIQKMIEGWSRERVVPSDDHTLISLAILAKLGRIWELVCRD